MEAKSTRDVGGWAVKCTWANGSSGFLAYARGGWLLVWPTREEAERAGRAQTRREKRDGSRICLGFEVFEVDKGKRYTDTVTGLGPGNIP